MSTNPFAAPQTSPYPQSATPAFKPIEGLQYLRMYSYIFENPNWMMNVLLTAVCGLIPIIGGLVLMGYQYEVVIAMLMSGGTRYVDFDFNKFADYLMRGLWPFLVGLIASLVAVPLALVFVPLMFMVIALAGSAGEDAAPLILLIVMPVMFLFIFAISLIPALFIVPMQIRAALAQDFAVAFNFGWVWDFVKKCWMEMFLGMLFVGFTGMILALCGMLACYIGMFFVMPLIFLAQAHFIYELYLLFLSRGGEPVQIKMGSR
jgi:hypothetical protein